MPNPLVLASESAARVHMLKAAGIDYVTDAPNIDEEEIKHAAKAEGRTTEDTSTRLAEMKAMQASAHWPGRMVLGADQMLDCEGRWYDKPKTLADAREQLLALRGRSHRLVSAAVIVKDRARIWQTSESARLGMRAFSDAFLDQYLAHEGGTILGSVGAYRLEGMGVQLFNRVEGNHFTILGLPLLPLLAYLREAKEILG